MLEVVGGAQHFFEVLVRGVRYRMAFRLEDPAELEILRAFAEEKSLDFCLKRGPCPRGPSCVRRHFDLL